MVWKIPFPLEEREGGNVAFSPTINPPILSKVILRLPTVILRLDRRIGFRWSRPMPYFVYIVTNRPRGTLYVGVTNDIARRYGEHRDGLVSGFSKRYGLTRLVLVEEYPRIAEAL